MIDAGTTSTIEPMVEAIGAILSADKPGDADCEAWIRFERDLRTLHNDTPLGRFVGGLDLTSFDLQVVAALTAIQIDPILREASNRASLSAAGPSAAWLLKKLCHTTQARIDGWLALQPGGPLTPSVIAHHVTPTSGAADIITLTPSALNFILGRDQLPEHIRGVAGFLEAPFSFLDVIMPLELREQARRGCRVRRRHSQQRPGDEHLGHEGPADDRQGAGGAVRWSAGHG